MEKSISFAKITKPRLQKVLFRKRLCDLLNESLSYPAICISGPGGSGKTTLVASFIEQYQLPCIWYQIDERDSDPANFFYYMSLAGKQYAPHDPRQLPLLTSEYAPGISSFTRRFFEQLFDRLKKPGVLVLDNYQDVLPDGPLHGVLRDALSVIPGQVNVFILSRLQPPAVLARARADSIMHEIGWNELRLQSRETRDLIYFLKNRNFPEYLANDLHEKTDGWIAGLILILKRMEMEGAAIESFSQLTKDVVFDYFATEIFEAADSELQHFLLKASIFPAMTAWMAKRLTGLDNAEKILSRMSRDHWFTDRRLSAQPIYQFHPMFRDFLLTRASRKFDPDTIARLKEKAAALLKEQGQTDLAVSLFLECGSTGKAVPLILSCAQRMVLQGRIQTLEQWLKSLPAELIGKDPWLIYWLGACRLPIEPAEAEKLFEHALVSFEEQKDITGIFLSLCGVFDSITYKAGSFTLFDQWIPKLEALSGDFKKLPSLEVKGKVVFSMLHALTLRQPENPEFRNWENRGLHIMQNKVSADIKIQVMLPLVIHHLFAGHMTKAEYFIGFYRELARLSNINPLALITLKDIESFYYWLKGRFQECSNVVAEALELASSTGIHIMSPYILGHGAAGALSSGKVDKAAKFLESMEKQVVQASGWVHELFHTLKLWQALLEENVSKALLHGENVLEYSEKTGSPQSAAISHLGLALALHASGSIQTAINHLATAFSICKRTGSLQTRFACDLAEAEFAFDSGKETAALDALQRALDLGREKQYVNTWYWRPATMSKLCSKALEHDLHVPYVQSLVLQRKLSPCALEVEEKPFRLENWPYPLTIYTMGRFKIFSGSKEMEFSGKIQKKPLEMLKALIALGGDGVSREELTDILYPESDGDKGFYSFKSALHLLRKLLGIENVLLLQAGLLSLNHKYCYSDFLDFIQLTSKFEGLHRSFGSGDTIDSADEEHFQRVLDLGGQAMDLYKGDFLEGEEAFWVIDARDKMKRKFVYIAQIMGDFLEKRHRFPEAVKIYENVLERDMLQEYFYRRILICLDKTGRRPEAHAVYQRCREILNRCLGVEPSAETRSVYKSLMMK